MSMRGSPDKGTVNTQAEGEILDLSYLFNVPEDVRTQTMRMRGQPDKGRVNTQAEG